MKALLVVLLFLSSTSVFSKTVVSGNTTATKTELLSSLDSTKTVADTCDCKPSLPLEIGASSIVWGIPAYWIVESLIHKDTSEKFNAAGVFIPISYFLLMYSLGPTAEWTSGCKASYWHLLWIGLATHLTTTIVYGTILNSNLNGGSSNDIHKFVFRDYLVVSVLPSIASTLIFNTFLHTPSKDQSVIIFPTVGGKNTASVNLLIKL